MKKIGLLGGMSWESTMNYYSYINNAIKKECGGLHSGKIILNSVDFQPIADLQHDNEWQQLAETLCVESQAIQHAGAECLLICTNTMHKVAQDIENILDIPVIHIADTTGLKLQEHGITTVGLLGTQFTMQEDFYKNRISENFAIDVVIPQKNDAQIVHDIIYDELCKGVIQQSSKNEYIRIIEEMHNRGAQAVILGCTEIAMLVKEQDTHVPLFDTTSIHAQAGVDFALGKNN